MRVVLLVVLLLVVPRENKVKPNCQLSYQIELVGVVSWTWVGLGFDNKDSLFSQTFNICHYISYILVIYVI